MKKYGELLESSKILKFQSTLFWVHFFMQNLCFPAFSSLSYNTLCISKFCFPVHVTCELNSFAFGQDV